MALTKLQTILIDLGLSETEARVYLSMVELGSDSVQNIAKKSGISRTAAYDVIGSLQKKGIASTFQKGKKTLFSAEDPSKVKAYFESNAQKIKDQLDEFKRIIPELRVVQAEDRPVVRFFTGDEGVRALFRDVEDLRPEEVLEVSNYEAVSKYLNQTLLSELKHLPHFSKVPLRGLYVLGSIEPKSIRANTRLRILPKKFGSFEGNIWIYKNRVTFVNLTGGPEAIIIESQVFADTMRVVFEAAWSASEPYKK